MSHDLATADYFRDLAARLDAAAHGDTAAIIHAACEMTGLSVPTVYRRLRGVGWSSHRKLRQDRGDTLMSADEARTVANLMLESRRATGKRLLSCADALDIALANGLVSTRVSADTALRVMRLHGVHPDQLSHAAPHTAQRSLHPNHVWQVDASICVLFYLSSGGLCAMDRDRFYRNKPANVAKVSRDLAIRYVCTDHASGAIQVRYSVGAGETQEALFEALMQFIGRDPDPRQIVHGVPYVLLWDKGSANTSHLIRHLLARLQVQDIPHATGNSRAKGSVEKGQDIVERSFEGRLYLTRIRDVEGLNEAAATWCRWYNATKTHSRHGLTRYAAWQRIREEQLRIAPPRELCELLLRTKPEPRQVRGEMTITYAVRGYGTATYSVAHVPDVRVGQQVLVAVNPYRAPHVDVIEVLADGAERIYECAPLAADALGFHADAPVIGEQIRSARDDAAERTRKDLALQAWDAETQAEVRAARDRREPAFGGQVDPITFLSQQGAVEHLARKGRALDLPAPAHVERVPLSHTEAAKRLRNALGPRWSGAFFEEIQRRHPHGVPEDVLESLAADLVGDPRPGDTPPAASRLALVK